MTRIVAVAFIFIVALEARFATAQDCLTPIDLGSIANDQNGVQQHNLSFPGKLENASCTAGLGPEVVFSFTIPAGQSYAYSFALVSQAFDGALLLLNGTCDYAFAINCNDDYPGLAPGAYISGILNAGSYFVVAESFSPDDRGEFSLYWEFNQTSDNLTANSCSAPHDLGAVSASGTGSVDGDTWASANHLVGALPCTYGLGRDIVYNFSVPANTYVQYYFNATTDEFEPRLILTSGACSYAAAINCDHWLLNGTLGAGNYYLAIDGDQQTDHGVYHLEWAFNVSTPEKVNNTCAAPFDLGVINGAALIGSHLADSSQAFNNWNVTACAYANGNEVIYKFVVPPNAVVIYDITVVGGYFTVLALLNNSCNYSAAINCNAGALLSAGSHIAGSLREGTYWLAVDGRSGNSNGVYKLTYNFTTSPIAEYSNACHDAYDLGQIKVPLSGSIYGDSSFALSEHANAYCSVARGPEVVFKFTVPAGYWVDFTFSASGYDTVLVVTQHNCSYSDELYCNDDYPGWGFGSLIAGSLRAADTYYLILDGFSARSRGFFWLKYEFVVTRAAQLNNTCDDPYDLGTINQAVSSQLYGDTSSASNLLENAPCSDAFGREVIFKFVVPEGQWVSYLFTVYSDFDSVLVLSNETCSYGQPGVIACNDDYPGLGFNSRLAGLLRGGTYYLSVDGYASKSYGVFLLQYTFNITTPQLLTNDCENPYSLGVIEDRVDGVIYGDSSNALNNLENANCSDASGPEVVFSFSIPQGVTWRYAFIASGDYDTVLVLLNASCSYNNTIDCNDDYDPLTNPGASFITGFLGAGSYYLVVDGANANQSGHFTLDYHFLVPSIASNVSNSTSSGSGSSASASASSSGSDSNSNSNSNSHSSGSSDDHGGSGSSNHGGNGSSSSDDHGGSGNGSPAGARALAVDDNSPAGSGDAGFGHPLLAVLAVVTALFVMSFQW